MPRTHSLTRAEFVALGRGRARRISGEYFSLAITRLPRNTGPKVACVVSKKVAARANVRNRIKRRCRSVLYPLLPTVKEPLALVLQAKRAAAGATFPELKHDILNLFARIA